jgi:hypothetical protein
MPHAPSMKINGIPVRDATKKVRIVIAKQDCKFGSSKEPGSCAAARACLRQVPECSEARVHISRTYLRVGDHWLRFQTPAALRGEIITFDRGGSFEAGEYDLRPLPKSMLLHRGKATGTKPKLKRGRAGHNRTKPHRIEGVREYRSYEYEKPIKKAKK